MFNTSKKKTCHFKCTTTEKHTSSINLITRFTCTHKLLGTASHMVTLHSAPLKSDTLKGFSFVFTHQRIRSLSFFASDNCFLYSRTFGKRHFRSQVIWSVSKLTWHRFSIGTHETRVTWNRIQTEPFRRQNILTEKIFLHKRQKFSTEIISI